MINMSSPELNMNEKQKDFARTQWENVAAEADKFESGLGDGSYVARVINETPEDPYAFSEIEDHVKGTPYDRVQKIARKATEMEIHDKFPSGFNNDIYNKILQRNMEHAKQQFTDRLSLQTEIRAQRDLSRSDTGTIQDELKRRALDGGAIENDLNRITDERFEEKEARVKEKAIETIKRVSGEDR